MIERFHGGKMNLMRVIYKLIVFCGCWRPASCSTPLKNFAYSVYCFYLLILVYGMTFCQFMDLILNVKSQEDFSETFYLFVSMAVSCHKMYSLLNSHENIVAMTNILESELFSPRNEEETAIRKRCIKQTEWNAMSYSILIECTVTAFSFGGLVKSDSRKLPYRMWQPYDYSSLYVYIFIYIQQAFSFFAGSLVHVACDSLIWALLLHTYSQIEILGCRLRMIKHDGAKLCVQYHDLVYRFATMINEEFKLVILVQFSVSTLAICFTLYRLTTADTSDAKMILAMMYISCMLLQIYIYCWYGNEVKLKSLEVANMIFEIDWTPLGKNTQRDLTMIMLRATVPIEITSMHVVAMNLESFVALLKMSYSAYNVLKCGQG